MKIVVAGDGKVGYTLTKLLSKEGHDVVVIDSNRRVLSESQEALDVAVVGGNGASVEVQREAGVSKSDIFIAATSSDEVNLLCCIVARKLGCPNTIARVRNPEYDQQISFLKNDLGLSMAVNPEKAAAREIFRLLQFPSFLKRDSFARGRVELVELRLREDSMLVDKRLDELSGIFRSDCLICAVDRDGDVTIPSGNFRLLAGDKISIAAESSALADLLQTLGIGKTKKVRRVMIIGGSRIATYLSRQLIQRKISVTIIEKNADRCKELCELLPAALVIHGNGTVQDMLLSEGIQETDALIALTGMDEENLIASMFANYVGVPKTITKINSVEYSMVFSKIGIDTIISPKLLTANEIVRYVRAISETGDGTIQTLYRFIEGKAEALEFIVPEAGSFLGVPLSELQLKPNVLLACIIRGRKMIIPSGSDAMQARDSVVVVTAADGAISNLTDILLYPEKGKRA